MTVIRTAIICLVLSIASLQTAYGQDKRVTLDSAQYAALAKVDSLYRHWYAKNTKPGITYDSTSFTFDTEVQRIISDPVYRFTVYKDPYTWEDVKHSLKHSEMKLAFWQMLNLYPKYKKQVLKFILAYDKVIPTNDIVTGAYYTYAMLDPRITKITSGKPELKRPDILEDLFHDMNEIVTYIIAYREQEAKKKK